MGKQTEHALLSASSAHRWLHCTAAPHFEELFDGGSSVYAEEGTVAHKYCELAVKLQFGLISKWEYTEEVAIVRAEPLYNEEMEWTSAVYTDYLNEVSMQYSSLPHVAVEVKVDLTDYVPQGFGTCDCIMIGDGTLHIVDYKHGKGVRVSAEANPQMMLYALGALQMYRPVYGVERVVMTIIQPRLTEEPSVYEMSVEELLNWGESIKPLARAAYDGPGEFVPGEHCRFCRGRAQCRARAKYYANFDILSDTPIEGRLSQEEREKRQKTLDSGGAVPPVLSDAEVAELLEKAEGLAAWYKDLQDYAYEALLAGRDMPGWKLVEGRSVRTFTDPDKAVDLLLAAGYDEALIYDRKPKTLSALEKTLGKKAFNEVLAEVVEKPRGKATLAKESDKRERYMPGEAEFAGLGGAEND